MKQEKVYYVEYKGILYTNNKNNISSIFNKYVKRDIPDHIYYVQNLNSKIDTNLYINETINEISLRIVNTIFNKDKEIVDNIKDIIIDKNDLSLSEEDFFKKYSNDIDYLKKEILNGMFVFYYASMAKDITNLNTLITFLEKSLKIKNKYIAEIFNNDFTSNIMFEIPRGNKQVFIKNLLINLINAVFYNSYSFEKLYKINPDIIYKSIGKDILQINNSGKINNVINLPKYVIDHLESKNMEALIPYLQKIDIDGNSYRIILEFLDNSALLVPNNKRIQTYSKFLENISEILKYDNYNIKDLLSHLIKESFYHPTERSLSYIYKSSYNFNNPGVVKMTKQDYLKGNNHFRFPLNEAILMKDYLNIANLNKTKYNKYPRILLDHNVMMENIDILKNIPHDKFEEAVSKYKHLSDSYNNEDYIMLYPTSVKDMIDEGNSLNHCVASYSFNILDGTSKIFFLRKKDDPSESFVTLEVDADNNLKHIRGAYNLEPDEAIKTNVKNWLKRI